MTYLSFRLNITCPKQISLWEILGVAVKENIY